MLEIRGCGDKGKRKLESLKIKRKFHRGEKDVDKEIQLLYLY
jgi:hypothetical protein